MLEVKLCGKRLKTPLMLGSGTLGEKKEALIEALDCGAGAVVNRTIRVDNTKRQTFSPAYYIQDSYMLNADNNNKTPWKYWLDCSKEVEKHGPIAISITARDPSNAETIVPAFEKSGAPSFYELNFSCSHSARIYGRVSYESVERSLTAIRECTKTPIFLKLSLDDINVAKFKDLESQGLFDAYVLSNSIGPGMKIDIKSRKPVLGSCVGGLTGPAIKPLVLAGIHELMKQTDKQVIGVGGIETAEDVAEYLILGCTAVQIYTAAHRRGVKVFSEIRSDLERLLADMGETAESIKGTIKER